MKSIIFEMRKQFYVKNRGVLLCLLFTTSYWRSLFQNFTKLLFFKVVFANRKDYAFSCFNLNF